MLEPVLDTEALRDMAFRRRGVEGFLDAVAASAARFPAEVYNRDDASIPLDVGDEELSELARDVRYLRRRATTRDWRDAQSDRTRLMHFEQLGDHLDAERLIIDPLTLRELRRREELRERYGIGRGEAAAIILAERYDVQVVFLEPRGVARRAAKGEGVRHLALREAIAA